MSNSLKQAAESGFPSKHCICPYFEAKEGSSSAVTYTSVIQILNFNESPADVTINCYTYGESLEGFCGPKKTIMGQSMVVIHMGAASSSPGNFNYEGWFEIIATQPVFPSGEIRVLRQSTDGDSISQGMMAIPMRFYSVNDGT
jgi:hypothetical protein